MKLKEQLELFKGKQIKIGAEISFFYCEECVPNILDIINTLSEEEYDRITRIKLESINIIDNFEAWWDERAKRKISALTLKQEKKINKMVSSKIKEIKAELKKQKKRLSRKENAILKDSLQKKFRKENTGVFRKELRKLKKKISEHKPVVYQEILERRDRYIIKVKNFIPFLEREVIEVYDSIVDETCKIIKVTGDEKSKYWDRDEYLKDQIRKESESIV